MQKSLRRAAGLIPLAILALAGVAAADDHRLGREVVPTRQAIELRLDADAAGYSGSVEIQLEVRQATERFRFHAREMELTSLVLSGPAGPIEAAHEAAGEDEIQVTAAAPLAPGSYTLAIDFTAPFNTRAVSLYRMEHGGKGYLFTQFQAADARGAFPCWDEPEFKIPFQVTLSVPEAHLAVSNTPVAEESVADGWRRVVFESTPPMPSYLLALAAGPLDSVEIPGLGVPGRVITVAGQSHLAGLAVAATPPVLEALEAWFDSPYPYKKLDFLAVPEFWPGAMENPGAVTYADNILLVDPAAASVGQRTTLVRIIAHELAHMWFGNLVTLTWWDDLWLNESFADWMGDKIAHQLHPEFHHDLSMARDAQRIMGQDARVSSSAIRRPVASPDDLLGEVGLAYNKGKTVLTMFEQFLGPEVFRGAVLDYLRANAWGNARAEDLWAALDAATERPVSAALATFIEQPGLPLVSVTPLADGRLRLEQSRFLNHGSTAEPRTWKVPVGLKIGAPGGATVRTVLLDGPSATVDTGLESAPPWLFPNLGAAGYYRWRLPADRLDALTAVAGDELTPRERVALIGNLGALLDAGDLGGGDYLASLSALADESQPLVLRALIDALDEVKMALVPDELADSFARYTRDTLGPALARIGLQPVAGESETATMMRSRLFDRLGGDGGDERVVAEGTRLARAYLDDPTSIDASLAGVALRLAAHDGDRELFDEYRKRFESASVPAERGRFLTALGAFRDPELRDAALAYVVEGPLRPNEIFDIFGGLGNSEAEREMIFGWFTENFGFFESRLPKQFLAFMPFFARGCSAERLAAARLFFAEPGHSVPGTERQLEKVAEGVEDCVRLRRREGAAVAEFLARSTAVETAPAG